MGCESFGVVGFDLGPLLQGQMKIAKLKSLYNSLIIDPRGLQCETNSYEILGENFLMLNLTFDPFFKVKQWFTGFGELSFRWIQICIGSPMRRSSFYLLYSWAIVGDILVLSLLITPTEICFLIVQHLVYGYTCILVRHIFLGNLNLLSHVNDVLEKAICGNFFTSRAHVIYSMDL